MTMAQAIVLAFMDPPNVFFSRKWSILSEFSCFSVEGKHHRLIGMLHNRGSLTLLRGRVDVQVVFNSHTIDETLCPEG